MESLRVDSPVGGECTLGFLYVFLPRHRRLLARHHLTVRHCVTTMRRGFSSRADRPADRYRRYTTEQISAQIINSFAILDMPLNEIRAVLSAPTCKRARPYRAHLKRLETDLARTQTACVAAEFARAPCRGRWLSDVAKRMRNRGPASARRSRLRALSWYLGALGELHAALPRSE